MNLLRRLTPLIISLLHAGMFFYFLWRPNLLPRIFTSAINGWLVVAALLISIIGIFLALVHTGTGVPLGSRLRFVIFPLVTTLSGFIIFLYSDYRPILNTIAVLIPVILWLWYESLYLFWQMPMFYQPYTLQRLGSYLYLLELFFFVSAIVGLHVLLQLPMWLVMMFSAIIFWTVQYDQLLLCKVDATPSAGFALIGTILAIQLFAVLNLLPTHYFLYGLCMALFFYAWLGIGRQILLKQVERPQVVAYITVSSLGLLITFVSALWIA